MAHEYSLHSLAFPVFVLPRICGDTLSDALDWLSKWCLLAFKYIGRWCEEKRITCSANPGWAGQGGTSLNHGRQDFHFSWVWLPSGQDSKGELTAERGEGGFFATGHRIERWPCKNPSSPSTLISRLSPCSISFAFPPCTMLACRPVSDMGLVMGPSFLLLGRPLPLPSSRAVPLVSAASTRWSQRPHEGASAVHLPRFAAVSKQGALGWSWGCSLGSGQFGGTPLSRGPLCGSVLLLRESVGRALVVGDAGRQAVSRGGCRDVETLSYFRNILLWAQLHLSYLQGMLQQGWAGGFYLIEAHCRGSL